MNSELIFHILIGFLVVAIGAAFLINKVRGDFWRKKNEKLDRDQEKLKKFREYPLTPDEAWPKDLTKENHIGSVFNKKPFPKHIAGIDPYDMNVTDPIVFLGEVEEDGTITMQTPKGPQSINYNEAKRIFKYPKQNDKDDTNDTPRKGSI